jgi:sarcosine oxidase subunit beta
MMATPIEACENGQDHDANAVDCTLEHLNIPVSIDFASRSREINQNPSFSVIK